MLFLSTKYSPTKNSAIVFTATNKFYFCTIATHTVHTRLFSRTVPSREVPGRSRNGTGQDLETLKVPWSRGPGTKEVQKSQDFF